MANKVYVPFTLFNLRIVNMQHVWTPSTEYLGKKTEKPNYFGTCILDRTQQNWWDEPALAPAWAAYQELLAKSGMQPNMITSWPVKDGNMPPEPGKAPSEWAKNRWIIGGSSSNQIKVEMAQPNGSVTPLPAKVGVKPGDYVALGLSAAIRQNDPRGVKNFCNTILFMGAGEEIAVGQSVTGAELMAQAQRQGLTVQGFAPSGGYAPQAFQPHGGAPQPGFPSHGQPNPGGFAPTPGSPAGPAFASPPSGGPAFAGAPASGSAYPSEPQQQGYQPAPGYQPQGAPPFNPGGAQPMSPAGAPGMAYTAQQPGAPATGYPSSPQQPGPGQAPGQQQWAPPPNFAPGGPR